MDQIAARVDRGLRRRAPRPAGRAQVDVRLSRRIRERPHVRERVATQEKKEAEEEMSLFARVHALVKAIPRGRVATYGQLSQLLDGRLTPVGIGWAMHG